MVYPRACGGTWFVAPVPIPIPGLSPRVRGNRQTGAGRQQTERSIPARAGEPPAIPRFSSLSPVYPRACGGTGTLPQYRQCRSGLSPRVRGNPNPARLRSAPSGSIPARAGEPANAGTLPVAPWVYPRACGGTSRLALPYRRSLGLSPRVRGNQAVGAVGTPKTGSIPARAGEP